MAKLTYMCRATDGTFAPRPKAKPRKRDSKGRFIVSDRTLARSAAKETARRTPKKKSKKSRSKSKTPKYGQDADFSEFSYPARIR